MSETEKLNHKNQLTIIETLSLNKNTLSLLELKKKTKLANLYFFKSLEDLKEEGVLERVEKEGETWISLRK